MKKPDRLIIKIQEAMTLASNMARFRTMHSLHKALRVSGYELADILEGKQKIGAKK